VDLSVINDIDEFATLDAEWDGLLAHTAGSSPFRGNCWLVSWWRAYASKSATPYVIVVRDEAGALIGGLALYVEASERPVAVRRLRLMGDTVVGSTGLGAIAQTQRNPEVNEALVTHMWECREAFDVLELASMYPEQPLRIRLIEAFREWGGSFEDEIATLVPTTELAGSWDEYLARLPKKSRQKLTANRRHIETCGEIAIDHIRQPGELDRAVADMTTLFAQSMSRRHGRPYTPTERYTTFIRSACEGALSTGSLQLIFLTVDGRRISFACRFKHHGTVYGYQVGFASEWAKYRVGNVINGWAIEEAIAHGCACYDFGPGETQAKTELGADRTRMLSDLRVYGPSSTGATAAAYDGARRWAKTAGKRLVPGVAGERLALEASWRRLGRL
jgi:CelD/BcsL family acetyltransferase involved in cellulose biosynthesis